MKGGVFITLYALVLIPKEKTLPAPIKAYERRSHKVKIFMNLIQFKRANVLNKVTKSNS